MKNVDFYIVSGNVIVYLDEESIRSLTSYNHVKNARLSPTVEFLRVFFPHQMESMSNGGILCAEERQNTFSIIITKTDDLSQSCTNAKNQCA